MAAPIPLTPPTGARSKKKKFVGRLVKGELGQRSSSIANHTVPMSILQCQPLNEAIEMLPANYSFEIHKTVHQIRKLDARRVALQMPEGLLLYACTISDIIERFTDADTIIMGDVTYGACCIDDYTALALGCDMLVHYGHSCLDATRIKTLYVFVEISVDVTHLRDTVRMNFSHDRSTLREELLRQSDGIPTLHPRDKDTTLVHLPIDSPTGQMGDFGSTTKECCKEGSSRLALVSTIQFSSALHFLKEQLSREVSPNASDCGISDKCLGRYVVSIPQAKPLSPGEILGCTAPRLDDVDILLYIGDGRFHLEAIMIANPSIPAFKYDPYSKKITKETYNHWEMESFRRNAIDLAKSTIITTTAIRSEVAGQVASVWGIVLGTLGRQGSKRQHEAIVKQLRNCATAVLTVPILMSELSPAKMTLFEPHISTFVQTSCPRLSIDWGYAFDRPLLNPYEAAVAAGACRGWWEDARDVYHMDFYAAGSPWARARMTASY